MEYAEHHAKVSKEQKIKMEELAKQQEAQIQEVMKQVNKVTQQINEQNRQELFLQKDRSKLIRKFPFKKIVGGKN